MLFLYQYFLLHFYRLNLFFSDFHRNFLLHFISLSLIIFRLRLNFSVLVFYHNFDYLSFKILLLDLVIFDFHIFLLLFYKI